MRCAWPWLALVTLLGIACPAWSEPLFSQQGADSCIPCHSAGQPLPATDIFFTPHGSTTNPDAPMARQQCETCHGPAREHVQAQQRGLPGLPPVTFGKNSKTPVSRQNGMCLNCHENHGRLGWFGSAHEGADLACATCHRIHVKHDRVFDPMAQQEVCFGCHQKRRSDRLKASSHPLRFGDMTCTSCHDPHNGNHENLLREASINETCFTCHAEKRGPFLWEHAPVTEDCTLCHQPHGSNHPALLTRRPPLLCQQCHSPAGHPSMAYTSDQIDNPAVNRFMLGRGCLNCHSEVHGSNSPSGATLHR